jgi:predicted phage-related endonuclease
MRDLKLELTAAEHANRLKGLGGSDAVTIAHGDPERIYDLWLLKTGQREPDDLTGILRVMMGVWSEELNRYWFERNTGDVVVSEGHSFTDNKHEWLRCTVDGIIQEKRALFEAKHVNPFTYSDEKVLNYYMPQLQHCMHVLGCEKAVLSVFVGTDKWVQQWVNYDPFYHAELFEKLEEFWECVQSCTPPAGFKPVEDSVVAAELRTVDMTGNNQWADLAETFRASASAAKAHADAKSAIQKMVSKDVHLARGHGIQAKRDARGALRIKEIAE